MDANQPTRLTFKTRSAAGSADDDIDVTVTATFEEDGDELGPESTTTSSSTHDFERGSSVWTDSVLLTARGRLWS